MDKITRAAAEELLAGLHGRIDALAQIFVALLVTHPDGRAILLASKIGERARAAPQQSAQQKAYVEGMTEIADFLEGALKTAAQAVQIRDLKPGGGH
jgi:hypothetical protein